MSEFESPNTAVLAIYVGGRPKAPGTTAGRSGRASQAQLVRAILSRSTGRELAKSGPDVCLAFDDARAALGSALSLLSQLSRLPPELAGIDVQVGVELVESQAAVSTSVRRAAAVARSAKPNEVRLGAAAAAGLRDRPPDGWVLRPVDQASKSSAGEHYRLAAAADEIPNNLGWDLDGFIGREAEIEQVVAQLEAGKVVTISGPPGAGKTRLAMETAKHVLGRYEAGAFFVPLAPINDAQLVIPSLASALRVPVRPGASASATVVAFLQTRRMLVVLDNLEHLTRAARDIEEVVAAAPGLHVIVTSRTPLRLAIEREVVLAPLDVPDVQAPVLGEEPSAAVRLFVLRAMAAQPSFRLTVESEARIADICRRVGGLPLAIELAAARLRLFSLAGIAERLDHGLAVLGGGPVGESARHHSLRDAIGWSYDLLDDRASRVFRRLSVFRGGWSVEGAIAVAGEGDEPDSTVLDALSVLRDASLVASDQTAAGAVRFTMLEPLREFAADRLEEAGEGEQTRGHHAAYMLGVALQLGPILTGPGQGAALDNLDADLDNLRTALHQLTGSRPAEALRMVAAIWRYWQMRGHLAEGSRFTTEALAIAGVGAPATDRASAMTAAGGLLYWQGKLMEAERQYEQAVGLRRELGDEVALANALLDLAFVYDPSLRPPPEDPERTAAGISLIEEAHRRYLAADHGPGLAKTEWLLGSVVAERDLVRARALLTSSVARFREQQDPFGLGWALHSLGLALLHGGEADAAASAFREALGLFAAAEDSSATGLLLDDFAELARVEGDGLRAARLRGAAAGLRRTTRADLAVENAPWLLGESTDRGLTDPADLERAWRDGQALSQVDAIAYAVGDTAASRSAGLRVSALGRLVIERNGEGITEWGGRKAGHRHALGILGFLLDRGDRGVTKDECIEVLWPDADVGQADLNFHRTLGGLRATLQPATVLFVGGRYRLGPTAVDWLDVDEFRAQLLRAANANAPLAAIRALESARALYRGEFLDDCPLYGDSEFVEEQRRSLRGAFVDALVDLGRRYEGRGDVTLASARYREALLASGGDCPTANDGLARLGVGSD